MAELDAGGTRLKSEKRLTFDERRDSFPSFSHDGRAVLFSSDRGGTRDIFRQSIDARSAEAVTLAPGDQVSPISSPDGTWFLFRNTASGDMMRVAASGGPPERVLTMVAGNYSRFRCIAPPAATCVLGERDVDANQYVFSGFDPLEGRGEEILRIEDRPPFTAWDLSRDGKQVAVVHNDDNRIRIVTLATGEERVLAVKEWRGFETIAWAPNDTSFFVNGGLAQGVTYPVLLHVDTDGNTEVLRQKPHEWHIAPTVSRDGRYLAFTSMPFHGNVWMIEDF